MAQRQRPEDSPPKAASDAPNSEEATSSKGLEEQLPPLPPSWAVKPSPLCWTGASQQNEVSPSLYALLASIPPYSPSKPVITTKAALPAFLTRSTTSGVLKLRESSSGMTPGDTNITPLTSPTNSRKPLTLSGKTSKSGESSKHKKQRSSSGKSTSDNLSEFKEITAPSTSSSSSHSSSLTSSHKSRSSGANLELLELPSEVMWSVMSNVSVPDLFTLCFVCKKTNVLLSTGRIWKEVALRHYGGRNEAILHFTNDRRIWKEPISLSRWKRYALSLYLSARDRSLTSSLGLSSSQGILPKPVATEPMEPERAPEPEIGVGLPGPALPPHFAAATSLRDKDSKGKITADVIERVLVQDGVSYVSGSVDMVADLDTPLPLLFGWNDPHLEDEDDHYAHGRAVARRIVSKNLDDLTLHANVKKTLFSSDRAISFVPPLGIPFQLLRYRLNEFQPLVLINAAVTSDLAASSINTASGEKSPPTNHSRSHSDGASKSPSSSINRRSSSKYKSPPASSLPDSAPSEPMDAIEFKVVVQIWVSGAVGVHDLRVAVPITIPSLPYRSKLQKVHTTSGTAKFNNKLLPAQFLLWKLPDETSGYATLKANIQAFFSPPSHDTAASSPPSLISSTSSMAPNGASSSTQTFDPSALHHLPLVVKYSVIGHSLATFKVRFVMNLATTPQMPLPCASRQLIFGEHVYTEWPLEFVMPRETHTKSSK